MKLYFKPDPFKDKNGEEIELQDIEIEYIKTEGCTACDYACGYAKLEVSLIRTNTPNSYISFQVDDWQDIQDEIEGIWNAGLTIPEEQFKRKNSLGRLNKDSGTKLQLDEQGLKNMNKGLKAALDTMNDKEDEMSS